MNMFFITWNISEQFWNFSKHWCWQIFLKLEFYIIKKKLIGIFPIGQMMTVVYFNSLFSLWNMHQADCRRRRRSRRRRKTVILFSITPSILQSPWLSLISPLYFSHLYWRWPVLWGCFPITAQPFQRRSL